MKRGSSLASILSLLVAVSLLATSFGQRGAAQTVGAQQQQQQQTTQPRPEASPVPTTQDDDVDEVVRITTNLVQLDVVVTDKKGRQVTDLKAEDFEITEDNRPQNITNLSYIPGENLLDPVPEENSAAKKNGAAPPPVPAPRLRPEQVRRTIALVVDDLGLSFDSAVFVRRALKRFVDEQMRQGDLVAILRTGGGIGVLQQFTSDRRLLYAAIERVRWIPLNRVGVSTFSAIEAGPISKFGEGMLLPGGGMGPSKAEDKSERMMRQVNDLRSEIYGGGTIAALNYIIGGLRELSRRKSILLISDTFAITERNQRQFYKLADAANRSSIVINTMNSRGLQVTGLTAADATAGRSLGEIDKALAFRASEVTEGQSGLTFLAEQTGGVIVQNNNDLNKGIRTILDDKGYYLIGYRPDESTFNQRGRDRFHALRIKVKRPGLTVRYRKGFYGLTTEETRPVRRTRAEQIVGAVISPFTATDIQVRLTSVFGYDQKTGSYVRSLLYLSARDLVFKEEADGWRRAVFDVLAMTFGDNGKVVNQVSRTYTVTMRGDAYRRAIDDGLVSYLTVPIKIAGAYQLRIALRDVSSGKLGSASQYIEVPDMKQKRLAISGLIMTTAEAGTERIKTSADATGTLTSQDGVPSTEDRTDTETDPLTGPAVRRFRSNTAVQFNYLIYNAQYDKQARRAQVITEVRLYRDGRLIMEGNPTLLDSSNNADPSRLAGGGRIQLGSDLAPGEYVLQIIVTDPLAKEKYRTVSQWIDFEVLK